MLGYPVAAHRAHRVRVGMTLEEGRHRQRGHTQQHSRYAYPEHAGTLHEPSPSSHLGEIATPQAPPLRLVAPTVCDKSNCWSGPRFIASDSARRSNQARITVARPLDAQYKYTFCAIAPAAVKA